MTRNVLVGRAGSPGVGLGRLLLVAQFGHAFELILGNELALNQQLGQAYRAFHSFVTGVNYFFAAESALP